jgi:hypothetical protein
MSCVMNECTFLQFYCTKFVALWFFFSPVWQSTQREASDLQ